MADPNEQQQPQEQEYEYYDANSQTWHRTGMTEDQIKEANESSGVFYRPVGGEILDKPDQAFNDVENPFVPEGYKGNIPEYAGLVDSDKLDEAERQRRAEARAYKDYLKAGAPYGKVPPSYVLTSREFDWKAAAEEVAASKKAKAIPENALQIGKSTEKPEYIEYTPEISALKKEDPKGYRILVEEGYENYERYVNALNFTAQQEAKRQQRLTEAEQRKVRAEILDAQKELKEAKASSGIPIPLSALNQVEIVVEKTKPKAGKAPAFGFKVPAVLTGATAVAVAEPTPLGELLILAALGGLAIYTSYKTARGEKVLPEVRRAAVQYKAETGREIAPRDLIAPMELTRQGERVFTEKVPMTQEKVFKEAIEFTQATGLAQEQIKLVAYKPFQESIPLSQGGMGAKEGFDISASGPSNIFIAQVAEKERELNTYIRGVTIHTPGQYLPATVPQKVTALVALDNAVQEAAQKGEIDSRTTSSYQRARAAYLNQLSSIEQSIINYTSNNLQNKGYTKQEVASMAALVAATVKIPKAGQKIAWQRQVNQKIRDVTKEWQNPTERTKAEQQLAQTTQEAVRTRTQLAQNTATQTRTQTKTQTKTQTQSRTATRTATNTRTQARAKELSRTAELAQTLMRTKKFALLKNKNDKDARTRIKASKGAIAWRQGELHGKDRWDVITNIYQPGNERYEIVLGRKPTGATVVRGPGSARKSAQFLYGNRLSKPTTVDQPGLFTTKLTPISRNKVELDFVKDREISEQRRRLDQQKAVFPLERRKKAG